MRGDKRASEEDEQKSVTKELLVYPREDGSGRDCEGKKAKKKSSETL